MQKHYVYILAHQSGALLIGTTKSLVRHLQHPQNDSSTAGNIATDPLHNIYQLVYFEVAESALIAKQREQEIRTWRPEKMLKLIRSQNPEWRDLFYHEPPQHFPEP